MNLHLLLGTDEIVPCSHGVDGPDDRSRNVVLSTLSMMELGSAFFVLLSVCFVEVNKSYKFCIMFHRIPFSLFILS